MRDRVGTAVGSACCLWLPPKPDHVVERRGLAGGLSGDAGLGMGGWPQAVLGERVLHPRVG